jgi:8-oxo-dGTP diphosphatase
MKNYVLGFLFNESMDSIVLIKKTKPDWQNGKLNGIGGKIEPHEPNPIDAMVREFEEETSVKTKNDDWKRFVVMTGINWQVFCYFTKNENYFNNVKTTTEEEIVKISVSDVTVLNNVLKNLKWMIYLAIDFQNKKSPVLVEYID